jgi:hypothetical protein
MSGERFIPWRRLMGAMIPDPVMASELSAGAKLAYGVLARFAGRDGVCRPSARTIAERLGVSDRQVKSYVSELVRAGYIERERGDRRGPNNYYFLWRSEFAGFELEGKGSSLREGKNSSPKENHRRENYDLDYLPTHRKQRDAQADPMATDWQRLSALVERLLGRRPTKASLGRIISATPTRMEAEAIQAIEAAERSGYDAKHRHGPRSASWFVSVAQNYWDDRVRRAPPPPAATTILEPGAFDRMNAAFDPLEDAA